ncbi:MAG: SpoIIE family protein phosphatase [Lachnospiraceae bacterium]|nr:SpoIIE family protein phosphatase [Lachnospiraceae bacterium]
MKKGLRISIKVKTMILIVLIAVLISTVTAYISYTEYEKANEKSYKGEAYDLAQTAALLVDTEDLKAVSDRIYEIFMSVPADELVTSDDWGSPEFDAYLERYNEIYDMPEYKNVLAQLKQIQHEDIECMSCVYTSSYFKGNDGVIYSVYLVDAADDDDFCPPGVLDHVEGASWDLYDDPHAKLEPYITYTDAYGWLVTACVSVFDKNGDTAGTVNIDLSMDAVKAREKQYMMTIIMLMIFVIIGLCFVAVAVTNVFIVNPIKHLSQTALSYISDRDKGFGFAKLDLESNDEIGDLNRAFNQMEKDLNEHIKNIMEMTSEKERIETELNVAAKIQMDMLPTDFPENDRVGVCALIDPAKEVGGDFYDFFNIDDDRMAFVVADVSGKGIPASLFMVVAKNTIYNRSLRGDQPDAIMADVNNRLCENNEQGLFVTVWLGILTLSTGELVMVNAGHENPAIRRKGGSFESIVSEHCPPLGTVENLRFETETITLNRGDMVFVYTDGVTEAKDVEGHRFGEGALIETLNSPKLESDTCRHLIDGIDGQLKEFTKNGEQFDDITMLAFRYY